MKDDHRHVSAPQSSDDKKEAEKKVRGVKPLLFFELLQVCNIQNYFRAAFLNRIFLVINLILIDSTTLCLDPDKLFHNCMAIEF